MDPNPHEYSSGHGHAKKHPPSTSELMASAKLVSEAAKSGFSSESVDKGKVASAAADLLDAACHYGKLDDKPVGKYVDKAETYLHKYHQTHSSPNSTNTHSSHNPDHSSHNPDHNSTTTAPSSHSSGGGMGEYIKMGQGLMNSSSSSSSTTTQSSSHGGSGSGGYGEYFKMAEGFLKKH